MHPKDHFSSISARYAEFRPRYPAGLFEWLASSAPGRARVWDCACGSGQASLDLAECFEDVIATDLSAEQLRLAASHPRVHYRVALAETSGLPSSSIDVVTVAQALHWFECEAFYAEARRVLRPGGLLAVWSYAVCSLDIPEANALLHDFYHDTVGPYWPAERRHVEQGYRSLPFPQPELPVPEFRMEVQWSLDQLVGYIGSWSATDRFMKAQGHDPVAPLRAALRTLQGAESSPYRVSWPLNVRAARLNGSC